MTRTQIVIIIIIIIIIIIKKEEEMLQLMRSTYGAQSVSNQETMHHIIFVCLLQKING